MSAPEWVHGDDVGLPGEGWMSQEEFQGKLNPPTQILPTIESTSAQMRAVAPVEFTQDDGSTYRRISADQFDNFDDVDSRTVREAVRRGAVLSQNGWTANDRSQVASFTIPGSTRKMALRKGDCSVVLLDMLGWIHANVCRIDTGQLDDWGYAERTIRGSSTTLSNHASGTAADLDALRHPLGVRGSWTPAQATAIRSRLRLYEGAIRWGEDYTGRPDGMHFEINAGPDVVARIAQKIRGGGAPAPSPAPQGGPVSDVWNRREQAWGGGVTDDQNNAYDLMQFVKRNNVEIRQTRVAIAQLTDLVQALRSELAALRDESPIMNVDR